MASFLSFYLCCISSLQPPPCILMQPLLFMSACLRPWTRTIWTNSCLKSVIKTDSWGYADNFGSLDSSRERCRFWHALSNRGRDDLNRTLSWSSADCVPFKKEMDSECGLIPLTEKCSCQWDVTLLWFNLQQKKASFSITEWIRGRANWKEDRVKGFVTHPSQALYSS